MRAAELLLWWTALVLGSLALWALAIGCAMSLARWALAW
jgi:hypothetical protein